jgi:hypothetical protein
MGMAGMTRSNERVETLNHVCAHCGANLIRVEVSEANWGGLECDNPECITVENKRLRNIENIAMRVASSRRYGIVTDKALLDKLDAALEATKPPEARADLPYAVGPTNRNPWPPGTPLSTAYGTGYRHGQEDGHALKASEPLRVVCQCNRESALDCRGGTTILVCPCKCHPENGDAGRE